ncbi:sucrase ferredoxin [Streptomyces alfalfae]
MTAGERFFCADAARTRGDLLAGTAPYGSVWVLVEHRGGWPPSGFDGLDLDPAVKEPVFSAARAVRARILLIRRHGRRSAGGRRRWAVLRHAGPGVRSQQWGTWSRDEDLTGIAAALEDPGTGPGAALDATGAAPGGTGAEAGGAGADARGTGVAPGGTRVGPGASALPPVVLVCAHGQHDTCCAVRGRPVGRALSERWPDLVWECSHVGGDRFAANVVVLPDGVYYGNLDAASCVETVAGHLAGRIRPEHLRGYTDLFPPQQVAVAALLRRFGAAGRYDHTIVATVREHDRWRVRVATRAPRPAVFEVEVRSHRTPPRQLTCRGLSMSSAVVYEVTSVRAA